MPVALLTEGMRVPSEAMEPGGLIVELKYWQRLGRLRYEKARNPYLSTWPYESRWSIPGFMDLCKR